MLVKKITSRNWQKVKEQASNPNVLKTNLMTLQTSSNTPSVLSPNPTAWKRQSSNVSKDTPRAPPTTHREEPAKGKGETGLTCGGRHPCVNHLGRKTLDEVCTGMEE